MMKLLHVALTTVLVWGAGCATNRHSMRNALATDTSTKLAPELEQRAFLLAVLDYVHRWYLDGAAWARLTDQGQIEIRVRAIEVKTDDEDHSRFGELWLPGPGLLVDLKQADHDVLERKLVSKDASFKVRAVRRINAASVPPAGWSVVRLPSKEVLKHLFETRQQRWFPDAAFETRLMAALAEYLREHAEEAWLNGAQIFYAAPRSPVCNQLWLFWENQDMGLRLATDGDLGDSRVWEQAPLHLRLFPLEENVAAAPDETAGGGRLVSRDWAGRLLYNCVVLGRRFVVPVAR